MAHASTRVHISKACRALLALIPNLDEPEAQRDLADRLGVAVATVNRCVATLVRHGFITQEPQHDGWGAHRPDRLTVTTAGHSFTDSHSGSRALQRVNNQVWTLTPELAELRSAMRAAGLTAGFGNLYPEVAEELTEKVRQLGVRTMVAAAVTQTWGAVRHVAAYLKRWRELRPPRPVHCAFHPGQPPRGCPECAEHKAKSVPMPAWFRAQFGGHPGRPPRNAVMSA